MSLWRGRDWLLLQSCVIPHRLVEVAVAVVFLWIGHGARVAWRVSVTFVACRIWRVVVVVVVVVV